MQRVLTSAAQKKNFNHRHQTIFSETNKFKSFSMSQTLMENQLDFGCYVICSFLFSEYYIFLDNIMSASWCYNVHQFTYHIFGMFVNLGEKDICVMHVTQHIVYLTLNVRSEAKVRCHCTKEITSCSLFLPGISLMRCWFYLILWSYNTQRPVQSINIVLP